MQVGVYRRDARAMKEGEWVALNPEFPEAQIKTRAMLPAYHDKLQSLRAREARRLRIAETMLGMEWQNRAIIQCIVEFCLLDVRGLEHPNKQPVTFDEFVEMISSDEYAELAGLVIVATDRVGRARADELEDAVKNSPAASATLSLEAAK